MKVRVLIADDSMLIRQVMSDMLKESPEVDVVGRARDGEEAVAMVKELRPDVVTMDVEMPKMSGIEALTQIMRECPTPVVMVSTLTSEGAGATLQALERGAADFVCKPQNGSFTALRQVKDELLAKIFALRGTKLAPSRPRVAPPVRKAPTGKIDRVMVLAASTGGPKSLMRVFEALPRGLNVPILVVQHMPPGFTETFAKRIDSLGTVPCQEARAGDRLQPGLALMAPGGVHLQLAAGGEIRLTDEPPIHGVRPAADVLFGSAAQIYGAKVVGAVLSGMGKDGAAGAAQIRKAGGLMLGEAESTCTIYGMPKAAMVAGGIDSEVPIDGMADALVAALQGKVAHAS